MTIFKDGKEQEKITLSDFNDRDKLNALFAEKGFEKYTTEEITSRRKMKAEEEGKLGSDGAPTRKADGMSHIPMSPRLRNNRNERKLQKKEMRDNLKKLKQARENFMVVGQPRG